MSATPDYSIIVPAYNEEEFLRSTLETIREAMRAAPGLEGEVIVVDNASTDRTAAIAAECGASVCYETHRQIARARNAGAGAARGRWLVFVDADTHISGALLAKSFELLASGAACGGGSVVRAQSGYASFRWAVRIWNQMSLRFRWACGAYLYCRADAFREVGGFDESVYASEDIWLSVSLRRWGKPRRMRMQILRDGIVTSERKLDWYGPGGTLRQILRVMLSPRALGDKEACRLWYERPPLRDPDSSTSG